MALIFRTSDGLTLRRAWWDGDLTFEVDAAGWPIDRDGERLEGDMVVVEEPC